MQRLSTNTVSLRRDTVLSKSVDEAKMKGRPCAHEARMEKGSRVHEAETERGSWG